MKGCGSEGKKRISDGKKGTRSKNARGTSASISARRRLLRTSITIPFTCGQTYVREAAVVRGALETPCAAAIRCGGGIVGFGIAGGWFGRHVIVRARRIVADRPGYIVARGAEAVVAGLLVGSSCVSIRVSSAPASRVLGARAQGRHLEVVAAARIAVSVHGRRVYEGKPK